MELNQILNSFFEKVSNTANVKSVYGDPIQANGKTIIPVSEVSIIGGGGVGSGKDRQDDQGFGFGYGGQIKSKPIGYIEVSENNSKFVSIYNKKSLYVGIASLVGASLVSLYKLNNKKQLK